ncbi:MAG: TRAP transporter small permease subunit [Pseudomonadota bacterium]
MSRVAGLAVTARAALIQALRVLLGLLLLTMVTLETVQVLLRYLFADSLLWGRDVGLLLLLSLAWLGAPLLWASQGHIAVDALLQRLPARAERIVAVAVDLLAIAAAIGLAYVTVLAIEAFSLIDMPSLGVSGAVRFYPVLLGAALWSLAALLNLAAERR